MICPFAGLLGVGVVASGSQRLLVGDRRYRTLSWIATAVLGLSWLAYFVALRRPELRVALEVLTVGGIVAGAFRLRSLLRSGTVAPLASGATGRALAYTAYLVRSPWIAGAKAWLLAMVTFQWLGRARFGWAEYAAAASVLLALVAWRSVRRPRAPRFGSLARFGADATPAACPLGFGCAVPADSTSDRSSADTGIASSPFAKG